MNAAVHALKNTQVPVMVVGTHELQGVIQELAQPFVCLQKTTKDNKDTYTVTGLVSRKILFNQYPKTLMR